jgi:putative cell wall-binding protein
MSAGQRSAGSGSARRRARRATAALIAAFVAALFLAVVPAVPRALAGGAPLFVVHLDAGSVFGYGWQANSQVMITIDIPSRQGAIDVSGVASTSGSGSFSVTSLDLGYSPDSGDIVTVNDGVTTKTHVVADIWGADSDEAADTVSGFASPNAEIRSWVSGIPNKTRNTTADASGRWTVDYSSVWNLVSGTTIGPREYDVDGDATETYALLPVDADIDLDTIPNMVDNCRRLANTSQYDGDADGVGALCDDVDRVWGPDRYWTAAAVAEMAFNEADTVFLALGSNFPDALVAAAAGGYRDAPVLLANAETLPPGTIAELQRLAPQTAYIVGGTAVIDPIVDQLVGSLVPNVIRLAGANRYATAADVSSTIFATANLGVFLATGEDFPDALVAAAAAGHYNAPVLLTRHDHAPQVTLDELARLHPPRIYIVGGPAAISDTVAQELAAYGQVIRVAGPDRYATAAAVAHEFFGMTPDWSFLAYGGNFPDALVAAAAGGHLHAPVMLVTHESIPAPTLEQLQLNFRRETWVVGGTAVISDAVFNAVP